MINFDYFERINMVLLHVSSLMNLLTRQSQEYFKIISKMNLISSDHKTCMKYYKLSPICDIEGSRV